MNATVDLSEQAFFLAFDKAPFAIALSRLPTGVLVAVNEAFERTFGYTRAEAVGRTSLELHINPDAEGRARIAAELQARGSVRDLELTLRTKSGEARVFLVHVDLVEIGGHRYILSTTQDITDRKRAEAERDRLLAAEREARTLAEEFLRLRDEFLSIASHELRTPLTTLSAHVQLLLRQYRRDRGMDPEQLERGLRSIAAESSKLARLIEQLLDVSRIQTGRLELARQLTDVHELVESAAAGARARTGRDPITLGAARPVRARVDPLRIEQVLTNLLENAVKYSPAGGGVEFAVRDHGDGIPPRWWQPLHRPAAHRWSGQRSAWNYHPGDKAVAACSWSSTTRISARSSYLSLVLASFLLGCQAWPGN